MEGSWIAQMLRFERHDDTFVAAKPERANRNGRLFGGLIAAQSLAAACATIEDPAKQPQSLHAYFVRGGLPDTDVRFVVERTRDGRSFDTRRVTAWQGDLVIFEMLASFHLTEDGVDDHPPAPAVTRPEDCTEFVGPAELSTHFEMRSPAQAGVFTGPPHWFRLRGGVEDDPVIRACALTFMSDMGLMAAARPPGYTLMMDSAVTAASLDHAVWFHRPFVPERWHCYQAERLNSGGARGLAHGSLYDEDGSLIATMVQEALWRV